jgi:hypothetical protein
MEPWKKQPKNLRYLCNFLFFFFFFFVADTFQTQPFHKGLSMQADVAFSFMPGA